MTGINKALNAFNVDLNVLLSLVTSLWSIAKTPLILLLITTYLSSEEQGFWYTFLSLGALVVFAEMGFTTITTQFLSKEFAYLSLGNNNVLKGDETQINKFISLVHYTIRRFLVIIPLGIGLVLLIAFIFFRKDLYQGNISFNWILYAFTGGVSLLMSLLMSILKGVNKVKETLQLNLITSFISTIILCLCLVSGLALWSLSLSIIISSIFCFFIIFFKFKFFFIQLLSGNLEGNYGWKDKIYPLQVKYSISWIAGYFIFSFIVPVTMFFLGPLEAGKVGITISLGAALLQMAHSWVANKVPELNMFIALNDLENAKKIFRSHNRSSLLFFLLASIIVISFFYFNVFSIFGFGGFTSKFLDLLGIVTILAAEFFKLLLGNWAAYLRAFNEEPYLKITITNAILTVLTFVIAMGIFKSLHLSLYIFAIIQALSVIVGRNIFIKRMKKCY